ncbi:MAG: hypothetical protein SGPRY_000093 [Prymnesium sp.]
MSKRSMQIGGTFVHKAYDAARLVSSKYLTAFSDLRSPPSAADHLSLPEYVEYLKQYCDENQLWGLISFGIEVLSVARQSSPDGSSFYTVRRRGRTHVRTRGINSSESKEMRVDAVCVCSGLHEVPHVPAIDGIETFGGTVLHSAQYKQRDIFAGKRVLVIGCGETGMDLAYRAVQVAESTAVSIKRGFLSVPYDGWGGIPLDTLIANLFEHSYEHRWLHKTHLKWKVILGYQLNAPRALEVDAYADGSPQPFSHSGTSCVCQWVGRVKEVKRGHHILCKSTAALPYMNRPVKRKTWRHHLWAWLDPPHKRVDRDILTFPAPSRIEGKTVIFADGSSYKADVIVLATGYKQSFPFLTEAHKSGEGWVHASGARGDEDPLPSEHFICSPDEPMLAFIGFVRPNVGAIPPMSELQVTR